MKKTIKSFSLFLALSMLISVFSISPAFAEAKVFTDGTYKVGKDIVAGEYIITPGTNYDAYYAITDENGKYIESDSSKSRSVVQLSNNQSIRLSHSDMRTALDSPQLDLSSKILPQGTYRAGIDIPATRYTLKPDTDQWLYGTYEIYEVYFDSTGYHKRSIDQETITEETTILLNPWQYLKVRNLNIIIPDNTPTSPLQDNWINS